MSPVSDGSSPFVAFNLNYRQYPSFSPGGVQLQVWSGQNLLSTSTHRQAQLNTPNEKITWTQTMAAAGGQINYSIKSGQSTTWGPFGNSRWSVSFASTLAALDGYSPDTSVAKSGVTWQSDHVTSLKLVQVRYYANGNLISTDKGQAIAAARQFGVVRNVTSRTDALEAIRRKVFEKKHARESIAY
jgi:hypothetical protein